MRPLTVLPRNIAASARTQWASGPASNPSKLPRPMPPLPGSFVAADVAAGGVAAGGSTAFAGAAAGEAPSRAHAISRRATAPRVTQPRRVIVRSRYRETRGPCQLLLIDAFSGA